MVKKLVSVIDSRWKKKPTKRINRRRKLKSALKMIFNYMKSDSYMFAPLTQPQSSHPFPPVSSACEVSFKSMEKKVKNLDVDDYLKCDTYMYSPLVTDSAYEGTTNPSSGTAGVSRVCDDQMETAGDDDSCDPVRRRRIVVEQSLFQSERVNHILHQNPRSLSCTGEALSKKKA